MPDWSYGTGPRAALFLLDPASARDLTLSAIGGLASLPGGTTAIALLGHMDASPRLRRDLMGIAFSGPVGLGAGLDVRCNATRAFVLPPERERGVRPIRPGVPGDHRGRD